MPALGIATVDDFRTWHEQEFEYLRSLQNATVKTGDEWKGKYVELLVKLEKAE